MREGMAAKSLKKKESKGIKVENQFLFFLKGKWYCKMNAL